MFIYISSQLYRQKESTLGASPAFTLHPVGLPGPSCVPFLTRKRMEGSPNRAEHLRQQECQRNLKDLSKTELKEKAQRKKTPTHNERLSGSYAEGKKPKSKNIF